MNPNLKRKIEQLVQEERKAEIDTDLLDRLHALAASETLYAEFSAKERNTLNQFFRDVRDYLFEELLSGKYGSQILLDAIIVLCFETGYKARQDNLL